MTYPLDTVYTITTNQQQPTKDNQMNTQNFNRHVQFLGMRINSNIRIIEREISPERTAYAKQRIKQLQRQLATITAKYNNKG